MYGDRSEWSDVCDVGVGVVWVWCACVHLCGCACVVSMCLLAAESKRGV